MRNIIVAMPLLLTCAGVTQAHAGQTVAAVPAEQGVYSLTHTATAPIIDGQGSDAVWQTAQALTAFSFPWRDTPPPMTELRGLWDKDALYFRYHVTDTAQAIGMDPERGALDSDRVEIFLAKDAQLSSYYTMEIDPKGQKYSARASYDMKLAKRVTLDDSFQWGTLQYATSHDEQGYTVEIKIPRAKISELDLWQDDAQSELLCALMRAEFTPQSDGSLDMGWMTWIDPNTAKPNFHNPDTFGRCLLR